MSEPEKPNSNK
jgi:hypothetical protein